MAGETTLGKIEASVLGASLDTTAGIEAYLGRVKDSPGTSFWLKDDIGALLQRDCLDAARDAEFLGGWFEARAKLILEGK